MSSGAIAAERLGDAPVNLAPLSESIRELITAHVGSTFADRGLLPMALLSQGCLLVSENRAALAKVEYDELLRRANVMADNFARLWARFVWSHLPNADSESWPPKVWLHLPPCLLPSVRSRYRNPTFLIDHRLLDARTISWSAPAGWIDELSENARILCYRDGKGHLHLPLDYFLPSINEPLQQALAAQAMLAAMAMETETLEDRLRAHTVWLLKDAELFPSPAHERLIHEVRRDHVPPLLGLHDVFARYLYDAQFVTSRKREGADVGPAQWDERRAHLSELRRSIVRLVPDDAEARDRFIDEWIPQDVAETVRRFTRGWSVPELDSVSLPALRGAVRNLFAVRLLGERAVFGLPVAALARVRARVPRVLANAATTQLDSAGELRRLFLQRQVTHEELFERMFAESRFVVIRSDFLDGHTLLEAVERHLPENVLLVFSSRIAFMPWPRKSLYEFDFEWIDLIVNAFLRGGSEFMLDTIVQKEHPGRAVHLKPVVERLLQTAYERNRSGRGRIHYFPDLADLVPLFASETIPVADYCRRLCERADELGARNVLWLEIPWGVTEQPWRKPDVNSPDTVHECLRSTVHDRAEWWQPTARLAAQQSDQPAEALATVNAANCVSVARFQVHHVSRDCGAPLFEALQDWWLGDFAIPGPLPSGLAELPIKRVGQLREVFGNYDHLLVRVLGNDDRDGVGDDAPDSANPSEGFGQVVESPQLG